MPIIAITGEDPVSTCAKLQDSPINQVLYKPFSMMVLREAMEHTFTLSAENAA